MDDVEPIDLPCYARDDYPRILEIMADSDLMPPNYDLWLSCLQAASQRWQAAGVTVRRWRIEPAVFLAWCAENEFRPDGEARLAYIDSLAAEAAANYADRAGPFSDRVGSRL